jgi:hypothetical protein
VILAPPTPAFNSSRRNRASDNLEKGADKYNSSTGGDEDRPTPRDRWSRERDVERPARGRDAPQGARRDRREDDGATGWATVGRARRGSQQEEGDRWARLAADRNKEPEALEDPTRRNGAGRARLERTWQREEQSGDGDGARPSWRDRNRERERDREWTRGGRVQDRVEEDPEWMDEPIREAAKEDKKQGTHTQEDFQRWKERMKAGSSANEERDEPIQSPQETKEVPVSAKQAPVLNLDGMYNVWGAEKKAEVKQPEEPSTAKPPLTTAKSRFGNLFRKEETPPFEPELPPPNSASPVGVNGEKSQEDKDGFSRILQMLATTNMGPQAPRSSAIPDPYRAMAMLPGRAPVHDQERRQEAPSSRPDSAGVINDIMLRNAMSRRGPQTAPLESDAANQYFPGPSEFDRVPNGRGENTTPRTAGMFSPPIPLNNKGDPATPFLARDREFLLNLIQNNSHTQPQDSTQRPGDPSDFAQFNPGPQRKSQPPPQEQPQQRTTPSAPPGFYDVPFQQRRPQPEPEMHLLSKTTSRPQQQQGMPPGFFEQYDEPIGAIPGLQRRNTSEAHQQQRQQHPPMSNMGIPSQQAPADPFRINMGGPPGMPPQPNGPDQRSAHMGPPPGFGGGHPPGFLQQGLPPQLQQQHQRANPPPNHPGMVRGDPRLHPGPGGMPGFFPGGPGMPPPGGPMGPPLPGFFPGPPPPQQGMPGGGPPPGFGGAGAREFMIMQAERDAAMARGYRGPDEMARGRGMPPGFL